MKKKNSINRILNKFNFAPKTVFQTSARTMTKKPTPTTPTRATRSMNPTPGRPIKERHRSHRKRVKWELRKSTGMRRQEDEGKEYAALLDASGRVLRGPEGLRIWIKKEIPASIRVRVERMIVSRQLFPRKDSKWVAHWSARKKRPFILNPLTGLTYWL